MRGSIVSTAQVHLSMKTITRTTSKQSHTKRSANRVVSLVQKKPCRSDRILTQVYKYGSELLFRVPAHMLNMMLYK